MKRNVLDWLGENVKDATSAILLTHNIDFLFLQSVLQSRLYRCGNPKLTVFADAGCAAGTYRQQKSLLGSTLGRQYRVVPMDLGVGRRFHPKALFLSGPTMAALAVGSGNLTHGGLSANREIWATFKSDADGLPALVAFHEYVVRLCEYVPQREAIQDEIAAAFDPAVHAWAAVLPEPGILFATPSEIPLLDRLKAMAGEDVQSLTAYAPYYDPDGEALARLGAEFPVPMTVFLQRGHVGLSNSAAHSQPPNIRFRSIDAMRDGNEEKSHFMHAKFIALHHPDRTILAAGSANISRAALMSNRSWGNAELVAMSEISRVQFDELITDITLLSDEPSFPETPPNADWEIEETPLRVLAARHADGVLTISWSSKENVRELFAEIATGVWAKPVEGIRETNARFAVPNCLPSVSLRAITDEGIELRSEPAWVDDESRLSMSVPERRLAAKLAEVRDTGRFTSKAMFEILQLLDQHLRQPVKRGVGTVDSEHEQDKKFGPYSTEDIFSDGFGKCAAIPSPAWHAANDIDDFLRTFARHFSTNPLGEGDGHGSSLPPDEEEREKEQDKPQRPEELHKEVEEKSRLRTKLLGALDKVVDAMASDAFVLGRPLERLAADISATWLLLRKGLVEHIIADPDYADVSSRLWAALFFGANGSLGAVPRCLQDVSPGEQVPRPAASAKLAAVLVMWTQTGSSKSNASMAWREFTSAVIAAKIPWMAESSSVGDVVSELAHILRIFPSKTTLDDVTVAWREWVRSGRALREFEKAARSRSAQALASLVAVDAVNYGDILWQMGKLCVAQERCRCERGAKTLVVPFGEAEGKKVMGNYLVPVASLLDGRNCLELPEPVRIYTLGFVKRFSAAEIDRMVAIAR